ncbi:hypothetical protein [Chishuiella sp.]|uniref:hypothetical protein n=1 Tax=Chishuiella sp. TaxID=1969467 RepID=UPI0028A9AE76|nr:hypothetical protein [Chishuiella sp.]
MDNIKITFSPTQEQVDQIYCWTTFPESNWSSIQMCFQKGNLCVATIKNKPVGFFAYRLESISIFIIIAETKEDQKNKGIAKLIKTELEKKYRDIEYKAFNLYCEPKSSQFIWKKLGFEYYTEKERKSNNDLIYMYSIFGDVIESSTNSYEQLEKDNTIEIWNSYNPKDKPPIFFSNIDCQSDGITLRKPILFFGDYDWKIRIKYSGKIYEGRYKDYDRSSKVYECFYIEKVKID